MTKNTWGATPEDWQKLIDLGLSDDLLPVVSNPGAPISANSTMKSLGKTPSIYTRSGEVCGLGKWTEKTTTKAEIARWRAQGDYGICIQTRNLRALDIDIPDAIKADRVRVFVELWLKQNVPCRQRKDSGKVLIPVWVDGEFKKRILRVDGGIIEFLANGQQFIFAGTHPDKARYFVDWSGKQDFVRLTPAQFETLWAALDLEFSTGDAFETKAGKRKERSDGEVVADATMKALEDKGMILDYGQEGQGFIECPFKDQHSKDSDISATAYFPKGSRGYDRGHFVCLHASCQSNKTDTDFEDAYGLRADDFEIIETTPIMSEDDDTGDVIEVRDLPGWERDTSKANMGRPKATLQNIHHAVLRSDIIGGEIAYDIFRDEIVIRGGGKKAWRPLCDENMVYMRRRLEAVYQFLPIGKELMRDVVAEAAKINKVDTAIEWLNAQEWDGKPRVARFLTDYLGAEDTPYATAVSYYIWTGLVARVLDPGCKADMVPILKGPQGYRKSSAIAAMAPSPEQFVELDFNEKDDNLARMMRGALVAEVPELKGLRTKDLESIKAFTARRFEKWVPKFREFTTMFPRRLLFLGTTNEDHFLSDSTGLRRWLPFDVVTFCDVEGITRDRRQFWAEAREIYNAVGLMYEDAERLAPAEHDKFTIRDSITDVIQDWLCGTEELEGGELSTPADRPYLRSIDIAREALGMDPRNMKRGEEMRIGDAMKALGYQHIRVLVNGERIRGWTRKFKRNA